MKYYTIIETDTEDKYEGLNIVDTLCDTREDARQTVVSLGRPNKDDGKLV